MVNDPNNDFVRDPDEWKSGNEAITSAQRKYLSALAEKTGEEIPNINELTKAEASEWIDDLQQRTAGGEGGRRRSRSW